MPRPRRWMQVSLSLPLPYHDLLVGQLADLGFSGFQQEDNSLLAFLPAHLWSQRMRFRLKALIETFAKEFPEIHIGIGTKQVQEKNWNALWERSAGIVEATQSIVIKPTWARLRKKDRGKIVIHIDPKMSFGTGHHASTRLCLELLEDHLQPGMHVLDFGTGTGILAIAARKLGAARVLAIDNDSWSIQNARENLKRNRTQNVRLLQTDRIPTTLPIFDLIVANIDLPTITRHLPSLLKHLRPQGFLLLSGILQADLAVLMDSVQKHPIAPLTLLGEDEWAALALLKTDAYRSN